MFRFIEVFFIVLAEASLESFNPKVLHLFLVGVCVFNQKSV